MSSCQKVKNQQINTIPVIYSITPNTSITGVYTELTIYGATFFPNGATYLSFSGFIVPIQFISTGLITCTVPNSLVAETYQVVAINNISYSPRTVTSIPPANLSYSNAVSFTINSS